MRKISNTRLMLFFMVFLTFFSVLTPVCIAQDNFEDSSFTLNDFQEFYSDDTTVMEEDYSTSLILDVYVDENGDVLIVGFSEPECLKNLTFLDSSDYVFDDQTNEFYAITDSLTYKKMDNWVMDLSILGYYTEGQITMYLFDGAQIKSVSYSEGFNHFTEQSNNSVILDLQGFNIENPAIMVEYRQMGDYNNENDNTGSISQNLNLGENKNTNLIILGILTSLCVICLMIYLPRHRKTSKAKFKD